VNQFFSIMGYEFKHLRNSPFKIIAFILFMLASIYGLQNGYELFCKQTKEIEAIQAKNEQKLTEIIAWYEAAKRGPDHKPWVDIRTPVWAVSYVPITMIKQPTHLLPFSIGQAEQFGYYKNVTELSSTLDADIAEEIANPERLAIGTLDFSFVLLYLTPILAIILLFNIGGMEKDLGFYRLIEINSPKQWLIARFSTYFFLTNSVICVVMLPYILLTNAWSTDLIWIFVLIISYNFLWFVVLYFINTKGKGSNDQAIKMASVWMLFCVVIPGAIHQVVAVKYPSDYMKDFLNATRKETYAVYELPAQTIKNKLLHAYPMLKETVEAKAIDPNEQIMNDCTSGLFNILVKDAVQKIEEQNNKKNNFIHNTHWLNPVIWFQNKLNALCQTDYYAYQHYRSDIQTAIDNKIELILHDSWNKETVNKELFLLYVKKLKSTSTPCFSSKLPYKKTLLTD